MLLFFIAVLIAAVYIIYVNSVIKINEIETFYKKLPKSFDGFKIVFISDMHDRFLGKNGNILSESIKNQNPDIIALGGDIHSNEKFDDEYFYFLKALSDIAPVYYVDGNHDPYWHKRSDYGEYIAKVRACGIKIINSSIIIKSPRGADEEIVLSGISYHEYKPGNLKINKKNFNIVLLHNPFSYDEFEEKPELMLSGHVHGGIVSLPFLGGLFSPGAGASFSERWSREYFFPRYYRGVYGDEASRLIVSVGIGNVKYMPFRLIRPEILVVTLRAEN